MTHGFNRRAAVAGLLAASVLPARAQGSWPDRLITLVHGFAPGGNADVVARIVSERLAERLGKQVVVDSRPGAGGTLAAAQVARAAPDGYTIMILPGGHAVSQVLYKKLPYHAVDDFSAIGMMTEFPFILAGPADGPFKTLADLIAAGRSRDTPLNYATSGNGTGQHLSGALFGAMAKIKAQHVPYRGAPPLIADLLSGRLDYMVETPTTTIELVRAGKLRALGVTGARRFFALPEVATIAEGGVPGYATGSWLGIGAPAGVPAEIVGRLNTALNAALAEPAVARRLQDLGNEVRPGTPQQFHDRIAADVAKWTVAVDAAGV
ncbi:MAG: tripartite tricarboxylate transporter substrate binding protein, partial [Variibacter sp.]|nr:tripartite tricarboxylate transporter substrate binding protein [Variibacter sp.]